MTALLIIEKTLVYTNFHFFIFILSMRHSRFTATNEKLYLGSEYSLAHCPVLVNLGSLPTKNTKEN